MDTPTLPCQCEHTAHFGGGRRTPNGNPGHDYGARFAPDAIVRVPGFTLCPDCAADCHASARRLGFTLEARHA